jgi:hypothetical protein
MPPAYQTNTGYASSGLVGSETIGTVTLAPSYEWSTDLLTWHASGELNVGTIVTIAETTITDNTAPANDLIEVTATGTTGTPKNLFVRLRATQR